MAILKDLLVLGGARFKGKIHGDLAGNADSATTITETLPIAKGGTGSTTLSEAKNTLGITSLETDKASKTHTHKYIDLYTSGTSKMGSVDPITQCLIGKTASNKTFGLPAEAITIEYSTDGGETWLDYGASDSQKKGLFCEMDNYWFYLGKNSSTGKGDLNNMLRVTIEAVDRYVSLQGVYVYMTTGGNTCWMDVEYESYSSLGTFKPYMTQKELKGVPGPNIHYGDKLLFNKSNVSGQVRKIRMTFYTTTINATYGATGIRDIRMFGNDSWISPNSMLERNRMYYWDSDFNVTFPAKITAKNGFSGRVPAEDVAQTDKLNFITKDEKTSIGKISTLESETNSNKTNLTSHIGNTTSHITSSERSAWNAKASTAVATTSSNGLMSASDKAKLNGIATGASTYELEVDAYQSNTVYLELKNGAGGTSSKIPFVAGDGITLSSTSNGSQIGIAATNNRVFDSVCSTTGGAEAKVVQIDNFGSRYQNGDLVNIYFKYENTSTSPTLNINSIGARNIRYRGSTTIPKNLIKDNIIYTFVYNTEKSQNSSTAYWDIAGIYPHTGVDIASTNFAPLAVQQLESSSLGVGIGFKKNPSTYYGYIGMNKDNGKLNRYLSSDISTYYTVHDTTTVQCGTLTITPFAANANTTVNITFPNEFSSIPKVVVTAVTGSPGTVSASVASGSVTTSKCGIVLNRPDTVATTIYWNACGY